MAPTIVPGPQMRRSRAPILLQTSGHLGNPVFSQRRIDHHLTGEFHSGSMQIESANPITVKATKATVKIADLCIKKKLSKKTKNRISKILMKERHCARSDATTKSVAHNEVKSLAELGYEGIEVR